MAAWKQQPNTYERARDELTKQKLKRGFDNRKSGTPLDALTRRTKCWNCGKVGHFTRNCKAPRRAAEGGKRPGGEAGKEKGAVAASRGGPSALETRRRQRRKGRTRRRS
eukprot:4982465-Lingulodinium_polyedra.AAC.1